MADMTGERCFFGSATLVKIMLITKTIYVKATYCTIYVSHNMSSHGFVKSDAATRQTLANLIIGYNVQQKSIQSRLSAYNPSQVPFT